MLFQGKTVLVINEQWCMLKEQSTMLLMLPINGPAT